MKRSIAARKRHELSQDGVNRRLSPAMEARRRLYPQPRETAGSSAIRVGPREPRFDYLTHSHD